MRCAIFGKPERPAVCVSLRPAQAMCGATREDALAYLEQMERDTTPEPSARGAESYARPSASGVFRRRVICARREGARGNYGRELSDMTAQIFSQKKAASPPPMKPTLFQFQDHAVRVVQIKGQPWFVAKECAAAICLQHQRGGVGRYLSRLNPDERQNTNGQVVGIPIGRGNPTVTLISESGLYKLIMR